MLCLIYTSQLKAITMCNTTMPTKIQTSPKAILANNSDCRVIVWHDGHGVVYPRVTAHIDHGHNQQRHQRTPQVLTLLTFAAMWKAERNQILHTSNIIPANKSHQLSTQDKFKAIESTHHLWSGITWLHYEHNSSALSIFTNCFYEINALNIYPDAELSPLISRQLVHGHHCKCV